MSNAIGEYEAWIAEVFGDTEFCTACCDKLAEYHARKPSALKSQPEQLSSNGLSECSRLRTALEALLDRYLAVANSGDCGNWNPEEEGVVAHARAVLRLVGAAPYPVAPGECQHAGARVVCPDCGIDLVGLLGNKPTGNETSDIQHLMAALVDQEGVLNECETLLREALDDRGVNVGFDDRLIAYWAKTKALSDWRTRDLRLTQKANDPLAQLEDDATFGEIVEEIQTGKMAVKEREGKL